MSVNNVVSRNLRHEIHAIVDINSVEIHIEENHSKEAASEAARVIERYGRDKAVDIFLNTNSVVSEPIFEKDTGQDEFSITSYAFGDGLHSMSFDNLVCFIKRLRFVTFMPKNAIIFFATKDILNYLSTIDEDILVVEKFGRAGFGIINPSPETIMKLDMLQ